MKILAVADLHGQIEYMERIKDIVGSENPDRVIICGDICTNRISRNMEITKQRQEKSLKEMLGTLDSIKDKVIYILGNDDWVDGDVNDSRYLSKEKEVLGEKLIPIEMVCITPFGTNREYNENKIEFELSKIKNANGAIIVAHNPPLFTRDTLINGTQCGSSAMSNWMDKNKPKIWLCGHIHEDFGVSQEENTIVFNCASGYEGFRGFIIDTETLKYKVV